MSVRVELPPALFGSSEQQLRQMYGYLYRMAEQLNVAMDSLNGFGSGGGSMPNVVVNGGEAAVKEKNMRDELQSLIVNTAEIINSRMDTLETVLRGDYEAVSSQWGSYKEEMQQTITATAQGVVQEYGFTSTLETLQEQVAGFSRYTVETHGYIRQGFVERDENGVPIIGIAIGQGLGGTETVVNGQTVLELDPTQSCAFYTAERVSFRIHGQEVAYLSNRRLYVGDVEVTGRLTVGKWLLEGVDGLTVKWIG